MNQGDEDLAGARRIFRIAKIAAGAVLLLAVLVSVLFWTPSGGFSWDWRSALDGTKITPGDAGPSVGAALALYIVAGLGGLVLVGVAVYLVAR